MFHDITEAMQKRMQALEEQDAQDRQDGTPRIKRLRQIPPDTGRFLAILAASAPPSGACLEIGTSGGYSALWLSLAMKARASTLVTFELLPEKVAIARKTFNAAKVGKSIELINGDARGHISDYEEIAFCFLDAEKEMYAEFYELVVPRLVPGGILAADNAVNLAEMMPEFIEAATADTRVDQVIVPIGNGVLVARKIGD